MDVTTRWLAELEARIGARVADADPRIPKRLTILYDPGCAPCRRCRAWMLGQAAYVELQFLAADAPEARERYGDLPWLGDELLVIGDDGEVWVGPAAFLVCLWALEEWRPWSYRLAGPSLSVLAQRFFVALSGRRRAVAALLFARDEDCAEGSCRVR